MFDLDRQNLPEQLRDSFKRKAQLIKRIILVITENLFKMRRQSTQEIEEEIKEDEPTYQIVPNDELNNSMDSTESRRRGRPHLPTVWSRVIHIKLDQNVRVKQHDI